MGILHMERGEFELAAHLLGEALEMDPYLTQSWAPFLHAIYVMGDIQRLEREVERGRRLLPDSAVIQGMEGVVLVLKHDFAAAEPLLKDAMTRAPDTPLLNMGLADIARTRGDDNRAESHYLEEVRMYPRAVQARRALVEIYAGQKRYTEQFEQLEAIVGMEPPNPFTAHSRAQVLFNMRRFPEALIDVERCVTLAPKYPACAMLKANTLKKLGREKEALQAYHHALKLGEEYKESRATAPKGGLAGHSSAPAPTLKK
jgi:tetratricopeptide (TPR) repeat protein